MTNLHRHPISSAYSISWLDTQASRRSNFTMSIRTSIQNIAVLVQTGFCQISKSSMQVRKLFIRSFSIQKFSRIWSMFASWFRTKIFGDMSRLIMHSSLWGLGRMIHPRVAKVQFISNSEYALIPTSACGFHSTTSLTKTPPLFNT